MRHRDCNTFRVRKCCNPFYTSCSWRCDRFCYLPLNSVRIRKYALARNQFAGNTARGFESHTLRQNIKRLETKWFQAFCYLQQENIIDQRRLYGISAGVIFGLSIQILLPGDLLRHNFHNFCGIHASYHVLI